MRTLLFLLVASCSAFAQPALPGKNSRATVLGTRRPPTMLTAGTIVEKLPAMLKSSGLPDGLAATWAVAAVPCALAFIRQAYVFSLSYGLAAAALGGAVFAAAPVASPALRLHALLVALYGVRLFGFLLWRQKGQSAGWDKKIAALDKVPPIKRTPIILSTSLFYALLASPLLFHLQSAAAPLAFAAATKAGCAIAAAGLAIEAVADQQKSLFKIGLRASGAADRPYTGGLYSYSRHPNYAGEVLFWAGSFITGAPAIVAPGLTLLTRLGRGLASGLGLAGIVFIMTSATRRLEGKQAAAAASTWPTLAPDGEPDSWAKYVARTHELF